ncbi:MAG: helicase C-terminal domain-containing protein, partial [Terricaulis sp.]
LEDELKFTYPLLNEILRQCRCVIGGEKLEIEPYFPATDLIQSFRKAKRRIYMTATLADDSVIVTHFGAHADGLGKPIVPSSSQSMGERMILMPQELNSDLVTAELRELLVELAEKTTVGLTVLVNRYDGIDLPGEACRVLAIVDLPEVNSYADLVDSEVLSGSAVNLRRQIERIEQGMGRGVRSNDDYCAVLLLGAKLTSRLRSPVGLAMLTPATRAQLDLSRKIAKKLQTPSADEIKAVIRQCLDRDADWVKVSQKALVGLEADDKLRLDPGKVALRAAFDHARANQHQRAVTTLDTAIDATEERQFKAWLLAKKAAFQHPIDADGAQSTLLAAYQLESGVLKPMHGASYKKLTAATGQQAQSLIEHHGDRFVDRTGMKLFADELCSDLQFAPNTSDKFEAAVNDLAWFLGIEGQRPEKEFKEGPDNLWALPSGTFLVIECKNGVTANSGIAKKDAGQLGQSVAWFQERYLASQCTPVIIHPDRALGQG